MKANELWAEIYLEQVRRGEEWPTVKADKGALDYVQTVERIKWQTQTAGEGQINFAKLLKDFE